MPSPPIPLLDNVRAFTNELDEIESIFAACKGDRTVHGYSLPYTPTEEGCLFSIWDAWTRFLRGLVISSCAGDALGLGGAVYSVPHPMSEQAVLSFLNTNRRGRNFGIINGEPKWHNLVCLADICDALGLINRTQIMSAVTAGSVTLGPIAVASPLEEIRISRNFAAHKNPSTLIDVTAFSPGGFVALSDHLRRRRSGVETFSEWKDCLTALGEAAAQ